MIRRQRRRRGANALEFALLFPPTLFVVLGGMEMLWLGFTQNSLESCTLRAASTGSQTTIGDPVAVAVDSGQSCWAGSSTTVDATFEAVMVTVGGLEMVSVTATVPTYAGITGYTAGVLPPSIQSNMKILVEGQ